MKYNNLGASSLEISKLSLGTWLNFNLETDFNSILELTNIALERGINFFDTAGRYSFGESEIQLGKIIQKSISSREKIIIGTKVFFGDRPNPKPNQTGLNLKHIIEGCHSSLKRLDTDYIDLLFCHRADPNTPIIETAWAMNSLISQGKIRYWGTSEWSFEQINEAYTTCEKYDLHPPISEQCQYNLLEKARLEKEYNPLFEKYNIGAITFSPLALGMLSGKYNDEIPEGSRFSKDNGLDWAKEKVVTLENIERVKKLIVIANELNTNTATLAIAWCMKNKNVHSTIIGASNKEQLKNNLEAVTIFEKLDVTTMKKIGEIFN